MRVLLLGPNGQLGTDLRAACARDGDRLELVPVGRDTLDVSQADHVYAYLVASRFDALVNCTGYHKTDDVEDNAQHAVAVNAHAVQAMAQACAVQEARFFHVSTDYVFGGGTGQERPLREDEPIAPLNVYGATKALGENLALRALPQAVVFRVASLFGRVGASGKGGNFVETMIRVGSQQGALKVVDDQTMSPTSTADVAHALRLALTEGCAPGIYHAVNSGTATWYDFACAIIEQAGVEASVTPCPSSAYPMRAARPCYSALSNEKVASELVTMPTWHDALVRYLEARDDTEKSSAGSGQ